MKITNKKQNQTEFKINDELNYSNNDNVRVIGEIGNSAVMTFSEAKKLAEKNEMDIIEINGNVSVPILRIDSYDKFIYHMKKNAKKNKQTVKPLKEIDLNVNIASNDLETKARKAKEFIDDGSKVKVVLTMKGRELARRENNKKTILEFITMLEDVAIPESMPKDEGNRTIVILKKK